MNNNINNTDWSQAVKHKLQGAETPSAPNPMLWDRISSTLDAATPAPAVITPRKKPIILWRIATSVAATAAILALLFINHDSDTIITDSVTLTQQENNIKPSTTNNNTIEVEPTIQLVAEATPTAKPASRIIEPIVKEEAKETIEYTQVTSLQTEDNNTTETNKTNLTTTTEQPAEPQEVIIKAPNRKKGANKLSITYAGGIGENKLYAATRTRESVINDAIATYKDPAHVSFDDIYNSSNITHHQPFGAGLRFAHELNNRFTLNSGVNYTLLLSDIGLVDNDHLSTQQIHFIGIPVHVNYEFLQLKDFTLYAGAGATAEYCIFAKVGNEIINERNWHYSADINLGVEYTLNRWLGLYFEPSLSHHFTQTTLRSIRNESPTTFNLRVGLSFKL